MNDLRPERLGFSRDPWYVRSTRPDGTYRYIGAGWATLWAVNKFIEYIVRRRARDHD